MNPQTDRAAAIVEQYGCKTENLIAILQDIQAAYNYLSEANLTLVADRLGISVSKVYSVATFYENFSLEAKGRHIIKVCAGTACHVRKSGQTARMRGFRRAIHPHVTRQASHARVR